MKKELEKLEDFMNVVNKKEKFSYPLAGHAPQCCSSSSLLVQFPKHNRCQVPNGLARSQKITGRIVQSDLKLLVAIDQIENNKELLEEFEGTA